MRISDWCSYLCSSDLHKFSQQFHLDTIEGVGDFITVRSHTSDCLLSDFLYVSNFEVRFSTTYRTEVQCDTEVLEILSRRACCDLRDDSFVVTHRYVLKGNILAEEPVSLNVDTSSFQIGRAHV